MVECTLRRALNLTYAWLRGYVDPEEWKRTYYVLDYTVEDEMREREVSQRWKQPDEGGKGEFIVERPAVDAVEPGKRKIGFKSVKPNPLDS